MVEPFLFGGKCMNNDISYIVASAIVDKLWVKGLITDEERREILKRVEDKLTEDI